jgi:hypothetical protein
MSAETGARNDALMNVAIAIHAPAMRTPTSQKRAPHEAICTTVT